MATYLQKKYEEYKKNTDFKVSFEDFSVPKALINIHEQNVGTVLRHVDDKLRCYRHIKYLGCMLFFSRLTDQELEEGPVVWKDFEGTAHCL